MFSRFRAGSELNRVNAARVAALSAEFARTLAVAFAAAVATDGLVDPTVAAAVEAAGYDRGFDLLEPFAAPAAQASVPGARSLRVADGFVHRPLGTTLDLTRRWLRGGQWHHHVIDPRTGKPSTSRWSYVTVSAGALHLRPARIETHAGVIVRHDVRPARK